MDTIRSEPYVRKQKKLRPESVLVALLIVGIISFNIYSLIRMSGTIDDISDRILRLEKVVGPKYIKNLEMNNRLEYYDSTIESISQSIDLLSENEDTQGINDEVENNIQTIEQELKSIQELITNNQYLSKQDIQIVRLIGRKRPDYTYFPGIRILGDDEEYNERDYHPLGHFITIKSAP